MEEAPLDSGELDSGAELEASEEAEALDSTEDPEAKVAVADAEDSGAEEMAGAVVAVAVANEVPEGTMEVQPLGRTAVVVPLQQMT